MWGLYLGQAVEAFEETASGLKVKLRSGLEIETGMVVLSIGVRPETALASAAGLKLGEAKGIWVDEFLQTSAPDVFAVGDAIEFPHPLTGKPWLNFLAGPANRQARIVADNMVFGPKVKYEGAIGTSVAKVFDLTVASTGLPAKRLKQYGMPYLSATIHSSSHAGYYPGASQMTLKVTFSPTDGKLYGGQVVGYDGVDKRVDELALTIKRGGTVYDLMQVEQAYAPPFSSAKDPVAVAGYVAGNILCGKMTRSIGASCAMPICHKWPWWTCARPTNLRWGTSTGRRTCRWTSCATVWTKYPPAARCSSTAAWGCAVIWPPTY